MTPTAAEFVSDSVRSLGRAGSTVGFPGDVGWHDYGAAAAYDLFATPELDLAASAELISSTFPMRQSFSRRFMGNLLVDADWRFSDSTLERVASSLPRDDILLFGTPILHQYLIRHGNHSTLIERNRLYRQYFDAAANKRFIASDVSDARATLGAAKFSTIVFDAPWTLSTISMWASVATTHLRRGGTLYLTLFPPAVRPTAAKELEILQRALATTFARSDFFTISYDTPSFETEILRRKGAIAPGQWRLGFFARLGGFSGSTLALAGNDPNSSHLVTWRRKVDNGNVTAVRYHDLAPRKFQFLDSVSSRHHLFQDFDYIDSANRIGADVDAPYW